MKWIIGILLLIIIILAGLLVFSRELKAPTVTQSQQTATTTATTTPTASQGASLDDLVAVSAPLPNATIASPLTVTGKARGSWYFEGTAPIELKDAAGNVIEQGHVTAQGNWMTADYVPFTATLAFPPQPAGSKGMLVLKNDNPSGRPDTQKELDIPVTF